MKASWIERSLVELERDRVAAQLLGLALLERLEHREDDAGIRRVGEAVDRQTRERHGVLDARRLERDIAHAADHLFGTVQRGAVRQLRKSRRDIACPAPARSRLGTWRNTTTVKPTSTT